MFNLCVAYCGNPLPPTTNDSLQKVIAYSDLPTTVYFSCPSDLVLTGPNTTTCVNNSRWEPDPNKVMCTKPDSRFAQLMCMFVYIVWCVCTSLYYFDTKEFCILAIKQLSNESRKCEA